jgi:hypothetical protein
LLLFENRVGPAGARALAAALDNHPTLMSMGIYTITIGAKGARSLLVLDTNCMLYLTSL